MTTETNELTKEEAMFIKNQIERALAANYYQKNGHEIALSALKKIARIAKNIIKKDQ